MRHSRKANAAFHAEAVFVKMKGPCRKMLPVMGQCGCDKEGDPGAGMGEEAPGRRSPRFGR